MGWKVVSLLFLVIAIVALSLSPLHMPWPREANFVAAGFSVFVAVLTFLVSIMARRGSNVWKGRGQG